MQNTMTPAAAGLELVEVIRRLMNNEELPHTESPEFGRMTEQVRVVLHESTPADRAQFGIQCMGLLIDAARAKIQTDQILRDYGSRA